MKIPKRELKRQQEIQLLFEKEKLTDDEIETVYREWNPAMISSIVEDQVYFTPFDLALDSRIGQELKRFIKANSEFNFDMVCDGIDCEVYIEDWKNLKGIKVESVRIDVFPWSLDYIEDSITSKEKSTKE